MSWRLDEPVGSLIDRTRPLSFTFEGRRLTGCAGDTVASALMANGVRLLSRSFKYHRPRGVLTMAGQDANTLVQLPDEPNVLADRHPLAEGLEVLGQNYSGTLEADRDSRIGRFSRLLPVGFYYKAFYRPEGVWERLWEPFFRRKAGLGRVDPAAKPHRHDKIHEFCDVAVVGGGPAGLSAALAAGEAGAEVALVDENPALGGSLGYARPFAGRGEEERIRTDLAGRAKASPNIRVLLDATCTGWFADHLLSVIRDGRLHKLRARRVVVAAGSVEQPLVFRNNDLPGIMLGSAAQRLVRLYGVRPGKRAVVATANRDGYGVALDLLDAGVEVAAVVDLRASPPPGPLPDAVAERGVRIVAGHAVHEAFAGGQEVEAVVVREISAPGVCEGPGETIACDLVCMSPGYVPSYQLPCHGGAIVGHDEGRAEFTIEGLPAGMRLAGSVANTHGLDAAIAEGRAAGEAAAADLGFGSVPRDGPPPAGARAGEAVNHPWPIFPHPEGMDFVDFDEDLQVRDIVDSVAEGYGHIQLVKRYSTAGMGPSQGRHSALPVARLVAKETGRTVAETGVTTARPPLTAEKLGVMAGRRHFPERRTPMHGRHEELGATWIPAGLWWRPAYYGRKDERRERVGEESLSVRNNVGLIDVSTLGGLEVRGPDACELLERMCTLSFSRQPVGKTRYLLMCNEEGTVIDDGVACRMGEDHFYMTATTSGVDGVHRSMLRWAAQWALDVDVAQVTAAWCGVNLAGPRSREVLERVCGGLDVSAEGFPYLAVREGSVAGIPARLLRVGFVGELGYEIHVPASHGEALWDALMEAGEPSGIRPFGVETQRLLRLEKGHIIIGQDTDSTSNPLELGLEWALSRKKPFFIGGRSLDIIGKRPPSRTLVGFEIRGDGQPKPEESHLVVDGDDMVGRVTSCEYSPTLGKVVGLATVKPRHAKEGGLLPIRCDGGAVALAKVAPLPFYDPGNERQRM